MREMSVYQEYYIAVVSILTRPEGRMQLRFRLVRVVVLTGFNPHPARRPDAICLGHS